MPSFDEIFRASQGERVAEVRRGAALAKEPLPAYQADPQLQPRDEFGHTIPQINWGGAAVALRRANLHFLIAGMPGSGKTLSIRKLLESVFANPVGAALPGNDRAVVYDPKQEFYPLLRNMGVGDDRLAIMNPFDARSTAWDLAADYTTPAEAYQLARTIIPANDNTSNPFFPKAAAAVLSGVLAVHMQKRRQSGQAWDLADIVSVCVDPVALEECLVGAPYSPYISMAKFVLGSHDTKQNVFAELASHLYPFLPIAALWRAARRRNKVISLTSFLASRDRVLLLGANQTFFESLQTVNRLLLRRLSELTLDRTTDGRWDAQDRTWLVLDELRELGLIPGLGNLINKGRSRGVCAVLGFQDYTGLKGAFGEHEAHEITANCAHRIFLRLGGESAAWASAMIGKCEIEEANLSHGSSTSGSPSAGESSNNNFSIGRSVREVDAVMPSEIAHLPGFDEGRGLHGYFTCYSPEGKSSVYRLKSPREEFLRGLIGPSDDPGFKLCDDDDQDISKV